MQKCWAQKHTPQHQAKQQGRKTPLKAIPVWRALFGVKGICDVGSRGQTLPPHPVSPVMGAGVFYLWGTMPDP